MGQVSGVTIYERDSDYMLSRDIVVAVGFMKPPNPGTSADTCVVCENFNPRCGTFTGPGQVGGLSVVTCAGRILFFTVAFIFHLHVASFYTFLNIFVNLS